MFDYTILDRAIEKFGNEEKSLIAVLQEAQEHYRYLPKEIFPYLGIHRDPIEEQETQTE